MFLATCSWHPSVAVIYPWTRYICFTFSKNIQPEHNKPLLVPAGMDSMQSIGKFILFTARIRRMGKVIVSVCLSVHTPEEGVPHLHPIILPLIPCPFQGDTPVTSPSSLLGGTPLLDGGGYTPPHVQGWGTPQPGEDGGGVPQDWIPPCPGWGTPRPGLDEGTPYPPVHGWGTPWPERGYPPRDRTAYEVLDMRRAVASCVHAGRISCSSKSFDFHSFVTGKHLS